MLVSKKFTPKKLTKSMKQKKTNAEIKKQKSTACSINSQLMKQIPKEESELS